MRALGRPLVYAGALVAVVLFAGPFVFMVLSSFKQPQELNGVVNGFLPQSLYTGNYENLFATGNFALYFVNSAVVALLTTVLALVVAILAGYALARFPFTGRRLLLLAVVAMQMFPAVLMAIPLYKILRNLGMLDARSGLILVYVTFALPFCIWMMRNYFATVPKEIEEAALIDGCGHFRALWRVLLPPALPGVTAAGAFSMILAWDEFLYANTFVNSDEKRTLSVGLDSLVGQYTTDWGQLLAGGVLMTLPVVLIFAFLQRYLTQIAGGGVKG
ncbi:ABC transporter permease [Spongiactinospora gelatinilytica]|uniref:ABC transporter permease n=1 Tax=Spongiactinospora gelatinilytica TaxID=2666298 RepID=A0A2W2IE96_9ACTN|nr:carbohydrate ABC transporter permease [Spongiactinospora gelatinilytica]PZG56417.1 ABC transporter permease [Spongiactinospora gelatinilytica]